MSFIAGWYLKASTPPPHLLKDERQTQQMNPVRLEMMGSVRWCERGGAAGERRLFIR